MKFRTSDLHIAKALSYASSGVLLLTAAAAFRMMLERSMGLHMLVQIPAVTIAGVLIAAALAHCKGACAHVNKAPVRDMVQLAANRISQCDQYGIAGLSAFLLLTAYWMIPKALDEVLESSAAESLKFASLFLAGLLLYGALARANRIIRLFFIGNFSAMTAVVGILYQDAPMRLCNFYLRDDQTIAGQGLVGLSVAIPALWLLCECGPCRSRLPARR
jgi:cytochrome c oxidase assembly factor CtaG